MSRKGALPSLPTLQEVTAHLQTHADQVAPELLQALGKATTACPGCGHTLTAKVTPLLIVSSTCHTLLMSACRCSMHVVQLMLELVPARVLVSF